MTPEKKNEITKAGASVQVGSQKSMGRIEDSPNGSWTLTPRKEKVRKGSSKKCTMVLLNEY